MKVLTISAALVLGLGLAGITLAQQGAGGEPRNGRATVRHRVANLRAEVELLQLEHDVDIDLLKKGVTEVKNLEGVELVRGPMKREMDDLKKRVGVPAHDAGDDDLNKMSLIDEATAKMVRPVVDGLKKEFVRKAVELNVKKLELVDLERSL